MLFSLWSGKAAAVEALACLRVRDAAAPPRWPQQPLAFIAASGRAPSYSANQAQEREFAGLSADGVRCRLAGMAFAPGGSEKFSVAIQGAQALILRKTWFLDETGHEAEICVNNKTSRSHALPAQRSQPRLRPARIIGIGVWGSTRWPAPGRNRSAYAKGGNSCSWVAFAYDGETVPLAAWGTVHADQNVSQPRPGRNVLGAPLRIGDKVFQNGFGCFAKSLMEFALNRQFRRFMAQVVIDASAEGRGSVIFEVYGDGRKLWSSGVMSGLDAPRKVSVAAEGVARLRLVVDDAGDGNCFDAAD